MENQGKRKTQVKFSSLMALIGFLGIVFCVGWALIVGLHIRKDESGPTDTNWFPSTSDTICNDSLEIKEDDSIASYDSFINVPAVEPGGDSIIMVDGIMYQLNNKENTWTPLYPDEDVMWIGADGDTIWE